MKTNEEIFEAGIKYLSGNWNDPIYSEISDAWKRGVEVGVRLAYQAYLDAFHPGMRSYDRKDKVNKICRS